MTDIMSQPAANEQNTDKAHSPVPSEFMIGLQHGHRLATFQECDKFGELMGEPIYFLFVDGDMSIESQWQTPFESSNPENKLPSLMAGLQSGTLADQSYRCPQSGNQLCLRCSRAPGGNPTGRRQPRGTFGQ